MTTELVPKQITPSEIFVPNGLDVILTGVQKKVAEFNSQELDTENKKDRDKIRSFASNVAKSKTFIDKARIVFVKEKKEALKIIDTEAKRFRDTMDEIKTTVRKPLTDWEDAEKERIEAAKILEQFNVDHEEALGMHDLFKREEAMKKQQAEMEAKQAELARIAEEQRLEKERLEREEQIKKEAAEQAKLEAENARLEAERKLEEEKNRRIREAEQAEKKRLADIQAEKDRAEEAKKQAEKEKQAAIDKLKREQAEKEQAEYEERMRIEAAEAKKAANKKHMKSVNNKIVKFLSRWDICEEASKEIVTAIVKNEIPELTVNY
jgi:hypothetical protein